MTLYERLKEYVFGSEWSVNYHDGNGPRCPYCASLCNGGSGLHTSTCKLKQLCDDIRTIDKAKREEARGPISEQKHGAWMTIQHWACENGGDDVVGTKQEMETWAKDAIEFRETDTGVPEIRRILPDFDDDGYVSYVVRPYEPYGPVDGFQQTTTPEQMTRLRSDASLGLDGSPGDDALAALLHDYDELCRSVGLK